ncbi:hypothetical protein MEN41_20375 [Dolichospermum sp. ST_con]|nr:hypothetical protein [Dolichospermum sp. ST_con]MDD1418807.1 hypothetical protein [Dolichospermum sp. ST_sed1]MDD1428083.1 hypothetical protein [Dolichospermum sp. ST_sed9]MDD1430590.1 hypothetical protein [Dolichospermum sp. ST_sed6]MDD1438055.1 hypothetical protein [Dolichospermum sp. ST_sed10]MDD1443605.1 hypothetical protein [Dolichospermum sp. ST_sed3]MDD1448471.1 hypothetical protein [Dolichospermum sp. ST_sed8]MDD1460409.1 hypothetical protein [Dolichospermum sp. ST_sed2]MDD146567
MSFLLEDMILIETNENEIKEQEENLQEIKKQLEEIFRNEHATISKEDFRKSFSKIEIAFKKLEDATTNQLSLKDICKIYEIICKNLKNFQEKYSDFFNNELINNLLEVEAHFGWKKQIYKSKFFSKEMIGFNKNDNDIYKKNEKLYMVVSSLLEALEKYSIGATQKEIDGIQYLAEILITRIQSPNSISIFRKILTTAKAILWEIDKYKKQSQNTVESLLYFLKTSPKWAGDDFEECLEYVNQVRRE